MENSRFRTQQDPTAEDYRAAKAALRIIRPDIAEECEEYGSRVQTLAERRANLGGDKFDLMYLLREPSNPMERADIEAQTGVITCEQRRAVYLASDPDTKVLTAFLDAWERQLEYYGAMAQAVIRIATDQRRDPLSRDGEEEVDQYARALKQKWPLWSEELEQVLQFLTEVRLELDGKPVSLGKDVADSAHWLATLVIERATEMWWSCKQTAERSQTQPEYLYPTSATTLFYQCMIEDGSLPRVNSLAAVLRLERVAAERAMARRVADTSPRPSQPQQLSGTEFVNTTSPEGETRPTAEVGMEFDKETAGLNVSPSSSTEERKRFRVALSFPGEYRDFVSLVADSLAGIFGKGRVLYDRYHEAEFSRCNLDTYLQDLYHDETELNVVFLCKKYDEKEWCGLEWRAIRDLIKQGKEAEIMFFRFDNARIPGLFSIDGYIDIANRSPADATSLVLERLKRNDQ